MTSGRPICICLLLLVHQNALCFRSSIRSDNATASNSNTTTTSTTTEASTIPEPEVNATTATPVPTVYPNRTLNSPEQTVIDIWKQENDLHDGDIAGVEYNGEESAFGIQYPVHRWPDGIVPYTLDESYSEEEREVIMHCISRIEARSCVRFVPRTTERFYLRLANTPDGCYSYVGNRRLVGGQLVSLESSASRTCIEDKVVYHELLHALGLWHEHARQPRVQNLKIMYKDIAPRKIRYFTKLSANFDPFVRLPYDQGSIMHWPLMAWANGDRFSMVPSNTLSSNWIGKSRFPSVDDMYKLKVFYNCLDTELADATNQTKAK